MICVFCFFFLSIIECAATPKLKDLHNLVTPEHGAKWKEIGRSLGLPDGRLGIIDHDNDHRAEDCCNAVWQEWLDIDSNASWKKVILAIDLILSNHSYSTGSCGSSEVVLPQVSSILQDMYAKKSFEDSEDDWPPYQPEVYTTVALIHHIEKMITKKAVISIAQQMYKGEIASPNDIANNGEGRFSEQKTYFANCKYTNNIHEIFPPCSDDGRSTPYTILIEGAPGIGKTVLSKEIAFLWANKKMLTHKKVLILIFLRDPCVQKLASFAELAQYISYYCPESELVKMFSNYLINTSGNDILFVFDGYDELPELLRKNSFIADIINRKCLPCCDIVITSRPTASLHLHKKVQRRIEILGFTDEHRKECICQAFHNNPAKIDEILEYLQSNPFINSLCYIPLNMTILMCLFTEITQSELPKTQTEINKQFICMTISRYFRKKKNMHLSINSLSGMPVKYLKLLRELSKLAFDLLGKDKIVFSSADVSSKSQLLSKDISGMGLLKTVKYFSFVDNCEQVSFNFLHFSLQELLAAFHVASSSTTVQEKIIRENFWNSRYLNTWIMYCGLTEGSSLALKHYLSGNRFLLFSRIFGARGVMQDTMDDKIKCLHLFQCFLEADNVEMCEQVGNFLHDRKIDLSGQVLLPKDIHTLGFFLTRSSNKQWEVLNLSGCYIEDRSIKILVTSYLNLLNTSVVKVLNISKNCITPSSLPDICKLVLHLKVQKLNIMNNNLTDEMASKELLDCAILSHSRNFHTPLTVVNDSRTIRSGHHLIYVINDTKCSKQLIDLNDTGTFIRVPTLHIWNCKVKIDDVKVLLRSNPRLNITIYSNNLETCDIDEWYILHQPTTASLDISFRNNISYALKSDKMLLSFGEHFYFNKLILNNVCKFMTVLQITHCYLTHEEISGVGIILSSSGQCWEIVDLSYCRIDYQLLTSLCNHSSSATITIRFLNLTNNLLSTIFKASIIKLLQLYIINELVLSFNYVSDDALSDALLSDLYTECSTISNFIHKCPLVVINDTDDINANETMCSMYFVNCRVDDKILKYPLQSKLNVRSVVFVNNFPSSGFLTTIIPSLLKMKVSAISVVETDLTDEVGLEIAIKLKKIVAVHQTIERMRFVLLTQTHLLAYGACEKQLKDVISHYPLSSICKLEINSCHNICHDGILNDILTKCSPNLYSIDVSGCSVGDNLFSDILTYLSSKERSFHLKRFDLSHNNLTNSVIKSIIEVLRHCIIEELIIAYNNNIYKSKLNNAIVSNICPQSRILNFSMHVPLVVKFDKSSNKNHSGNYVSSAYVYMVNCAVTDDLVYKFNKLSQEETFVQSLVFCNNQMSMNASVYTFSLPKSKYTMTKIAEEDDCISTHNFIENTEYNSGYVSVKIDATPYVNCNNYTLVHNKLIIFLVVHQQLIEVLSEHEEINSLQFVNCNMLNSELKQVGNIVSCSNKNWKSIDLSGCNIGDSGCNALRPGRSIYCNVAVKNFNLSSNSLTVSSLNDLHQIIFHWKIEQLVIAGNDISQCDVNHMITSNVQQDMSECFPLQLQVLTTNRSVIVCNKKYLFTPMQQDTIRLTAVANHTAECDAEILTSSNAMISMTGASCRVTLSEMIQTHSMHTLTNVIVDENKLKSDLSKELGCSRHVVQEIQLSTPLCHLCVAHCNISDEEAYVISDAISLSESVESIILINNDIHKQSFIKIITSLQCSSIIRHICISFIVISNAAASILASVINFNTSLEHICLSHCDLKEQGMLIIFKSLKTIMSLRHCDFSDNYITTESAKQLSSVVQSNCMLVHFNISNCKLHQEGLFCITEALAELSTLNSLNLSNIIIDITSAIQLSKAVKANIELNHVDLSKCMLTEEGLAKITSSLSELPSLHYINLNYNVISDQIAQQLSNCFANIKHLLVGNCKMKWSSLSSILCAMQGISSLQQLNISGSDVNTTQLLDVVNKNGDINHLELASCASPVDGLPGKFLPIDYLNVSGNTFNNTSVKHIGAAILRYSLLKYFKMSKCYFHGTDAKYIFHCLRMNKSGISLLDVSFNTITNGTATFLTAVLVNNCTLKHLYLQHCNIPEQGILEIMNGLKSCNHLRTLDFSYNSIPNVGTYLMNEFISANFNLMHLAVASCGLTERCTATTVEGLFQTRKIIHLDISYNTLDDDGANKLATTLLCSTSLKHLDLSYCELSENILIRICKSLSSLSSLRHLNIAGNKITDVVSENLATTLSGNLSLIYLNLCNCQLPEIGFNRILGTLCDNNVLHHLKVNYNVTSDQVASKMCDLIATSCSLTTLEIGSCNLSEKGVKTIFKSLRDKPMQCLDLSFNRIGTSATDAIANTLLASEYIEHLDISGCDLSEPQFIQLAGSLRNNIKLIHINISNNCITNRVALAVASTISGTISLQYINLSNCNLNSVALTTITNALSQITTLKTLIISSNRVSTVGANCIANVITRNTSLEQVDLSNCMLQHGDKVMITHAVLKATKLNYFRIN